MLFSVPWYEPYIRNRTKPDGVGDGQEDEEYSDAIGRGYRAA